MSENIKCESGHKHVLIPSKEIMRKLQMLGAIVTISTVAITSFSGCNEIRHGVEEFEKTTDVSYTQRMEDTEKTTEESISTTESYEEKVESINFIEKIQKEGKYKEDRTKPLTDKEYNELLSNLNSILVEKKFPEEANSLILDMFNRLCKNYLTWQNGYINMPSTKDYITNNLIESLKKITKIEFVDKSSEEGQRRIDEGEAFASTGPYGKSGLIVRIIADKKENASEQDREYDIERLAHEIVGHCKHREMLDNLDYFANNDELYLLIVEGSATFNQKFVNPYSTDIYASAIAENEDGSSTIEYTKDDGIGYIRYLNLYEKLVFLLGYDVINEAENGVITYSGIEQKLLDYYGKDGEKFVKLMKKWFMEYEKSYKGDDTFNLCIEFENCFMKMIETNINLINDEELLKKYKLAFDQYFERNMPISINEEGLNISESIFKYKHVYELFEKQFSKGMQSKEETIIDEEEIEH